MSRKLTIEVDRASEADAAAVESVLDAAAEWLQRRGVDQWRPGSFTQEIRTAVAAGEMYVARRERDLVGVFRLAVLAAEADRAWSLEVPECGSGRAAYLSRLAVARHAAGRGLGVQMLDHSARIAELAECDFLRLDCWAGNDRLRRYYREARFDECGEIRVPTRDRGGEAVSVSLFQRPLRSRSAGANDE